MTPVEINIETDIKRILKEHYDLEAVTAEAVHGTLYRVRSKPSGPYYIIKLHRIQGRDSLPVLSRIYQLAGEKGFSPKMVSTRNGDTIGSTKGVYFSLQEYMPGRLMEESDTALLPQRLAALHRLLCNNGPVSIVNHFFSLIPDIFEACRHYGYNNLLPIIADVEDYCKLHSPQVIHGDLHPGNILYYQNRIMFIDFDSATTLPVSMDVAFCAFRCLDGNAHAMTHFVENYNRSNPPSMVAGDRIWEQLAYLILQRILFIRIEQDKGNEQWLSDLENQHAYLNRVLAVLHRDD